MIICKILEDPQSSSCLNISYGEIQGLVANPHPTGSPYAPVSNLLMIIDSELLFRIKQKSAIRILVFMKREMGWFLFKDNMTFYLCMSLDSRWSFISNKL